MEQPGRYPVSKEARDLTSSGPLISHPNVRVAQAYGTGTWLCSTSREGHEQAFALRNVHLCSVRGGSREEEAPAAQVSLGTSRGCR